jgi:hypothetical protein
VEGRREGRKEKEEKCTPGESIDVDVMTTVTPKIQFKSFT